LRRRGVDIEASGAVVLPFGTKDAAKIKESIVSRIRPQKAARQISTINAAHTHLSIAPSRHSKSFCFSAQSIRIARVNHTALA
jgi:hypothetical protein